MEPNALVIEEIGGLFESVTLPPNLSLTWEWSLRRLAFDYCIEMACFDIDDRKTPIKISMQKCVLLDEFEVALPLVEFVQHLVADLALEMLEHELYEWLTVGGEQCRWHDMGGNHDPR